MSKHTLRMPKPKVWNYSYSNRSSQGALITQTSRFPKTFDSEKMDYLSIYSDRMPSHVQDKIRKITTRMNWQDMQSKSDKELQHFAQVAFELNRPPQHVRLIYYYNVSNGYCCPVVIALKRK